MIALIVRTVYKVLGVSPGLCVKKGKQPSTVLSPSGCLSACLSQPKWAKSLLICCLPWGGVGNSSPSAKDIIKIPDSQSEYQTENNCLSKVISEPNGNTLRMSTPKVLASSPMCFLAGLGILQLSVLPPLPTAESGDDMGFMLFN